MQVALTDTAALDSEIAALLSEMEVVAELTKQCIEKNSTTAQDQTTHLERYNILADLQIPDRTRNSSLTRK